MKFDPQWLAVQREAQLAAEQVAYGVTALGRANHAYKGLYTQAFFGLSNGLERIGKLIILADYAIKSGTFPKDQNLRKIGHDLKLILDKCEAIGACLSQSQKNMKRPSDPIHKGIEEVLSLFAKTLRYYNLDYLAGSTEGQQDPTALWWKKVAIPICSRHYSQRQREKDGIEAAFFENELSDHSFVLYSPEAGTPIKDISTLILQGKLTKIVQKYGRLYTLQIVRWLTLIISHLPYDKVESLSGLNEPFQIFHTEDKYLRDRKTWSIYKP